MGCDGSNRVPIPTPAGSHQSATEENDDEHEEARSHEVSIKLVDGVLHDLHFAMSVPAQKNVSEIEPEPGVAGQVFVAFSEVKWP